MSNAANYTSHLPGVNLVIADKLNKIKLNNLNPIKRQKDYRQQGKSIQNALTVNRLFLLFLVSGYTGLKL